MFLKQLKAQLLNRHTLLILLGLTLLIMVSYWNVVFRGEKVDFISATGEVRSLKSIPSHLFWNILRTGKLLSYFYLACSLVPALEAAPVWKGGVHYALFIRTSWTRYALVRGIATVVVGGLVMTLPMVIAWGVTWATRVPSEVFWSDQPLIEFVYQTTENDVIRNQFYELCATPYLRREVMPKLLEIVTATMYPDADSYELMMELKALYASVPVREYVIMELQYGALQLAGQFVIGAMWSMVGLAISAWLPNRFAVAGITLLIYHLSTVVINAVSSPALLHVLKQRDVISGMMSSAYGYSFLWGYLMIAAEILFFFILYCWGVGRRVKNG